MAAPDQRTPARRPLPVAPDILAAAVSAVCDRVRRGHCCPDARPQLCSAADTGYCRSRPVPRKHRTAAKPQRTSLPAASHLAMRQHLRPFVCLERKQRGPPRLCCSIRPGWHRWAEMTVPPGRGYDRLRTHAISGHPSQRTPTAAAGCRTDTTAVVPIGQRTSRHVRGDRSWTARQPRIAPLTGAGQRGSLSLEFRLRFRSTAGHRTLPWRPVPQTTGHRLQGRVRGPIPALRQRGALRLLVCARSCG
jgi:hypothetical protein